MGMEICQRLWSTFRSQFQHCEANMLNFHENNPPMGAGGYVKQPAEVDDGGCFEPFVPKVVSVSPAPKPAPKPKRSWTSELDEILRGQGFAIPPDATPETAIPVSPAGGTAGDSEMAQPSETLTASAEAPLPPPRVATAVQLFTWIKRTILAQTHLPENVAEIVAFWVISTWFQDALTVLPCLVVTGPAHDAEVLLHALRDLCRGAALLAGFRQSHLSVLRWGCVTSLISEPNLDKRTANLLSNLTDRRYLVVEGGSLSCCSKSAAIYAGENPGTHNIQNSIRIHITPTNEAPSVPPQSLQKTIERLPVHLDQYRQKNLDYVHRWTWVPEGVSSETVAIATALGRGIVDAPPLRQKLVALLKPLAQQRLCEMSNTTEAIVVEAVQALTHDGRGHAYSWEIAAEVNRRLEDRGETARLSPEKVGQRLKKLGLPTRRLSQTGNGLTFDKATVAAIHQLAAVYVMEDMPTETEHLHR
jgi:hypothetical protein